MMNVKNKKIYSDKLCIHVLSLNQIEMATQEDKNYDKALTMLVFRECAMLKLSDYSRRYRVLENMIL